MFMKRVPHMHVREYAYRLMQWFVSLTTHTRAKISDLIDTRAKITGLIDTFAKISDLFDTRAKNDEDCHSSLQLM